jgi:hypothetical protein
MAELQDYILKFDLTKFKTQIGEVGGAFTEFGDGLRANISSTSDKFGSLQATVAETAGEIGQLSPKVDDSAARISAAIDSSSKGMDVISAYSATISSQLKALQEKGAGGGSSKATKASMEQLNQFKGAFDTINKTSKKSKQQATFASKAAKKSLGAVKAGSDKIIKSIKSEARMAAAKLKSLQSHIPGGGFSSGIIGGLIGAMVLGVTEKDRLKWWSGEVLNVFEASGESLSSKSAKKATNFFANFQNQSHHMLGISKEEVQSNLKVMIDAGYQSRDIMTTFDKTLGLVGKNLGTATMALDKHFNQQTGTSIQNITVLTQDLGGSLKEVTHEYTRLGFAAQRSGMGINKFVDAVMAGSSGMKQYGVEMKSVADTMTTIQKHYQGMGLSPQYSGGQAAQVVQGLSGGLTNMTPEMKAMLAKQMFPELAVEDAMQKWEDGFKRVAAGEDDNFMQNVYQEMYKWAVGNGRSRSNAIRLMEYQGLDNRTAATVYDLKGEVASTNALKKLSHAERKKMRNAFKTESQKISDLAKLQFKLKQAIAKIGTGLLKVLSALVGNIAVLVKMVPAMLSNMHDRAKMSQISARANHYFTVLNDHAADGIMDIRRGSKEAAKALGDEFGNKSEFKPLIDVLKWKPPVSDFEKTITEIAGQLGGVKSAEEWQLSNYKQTMKHGLEWQEEDDGRITFPNPYTGETYDDVETATTEIIRYKREIENMKQLRDNLQAKVDKRGMDPEKAQAELDEAMADKERLREARVAKEADLRARQEAVNELTLVITHEEMQSARNKSDANKVVPAGSGQ